MNRVKLYLISRVQIRIENYRKPLNFVVYLPCCELRLLLALCSSTNLTEEASSVSFSLWMTRKAHAFGVPFTKKRKHLGDNLKELHNKLYGHVLQLKVEFIVCHWKY